jgi:hypothetical protein
MGIKKFSSFISENSSESFDELHKELKNNGYDCIKSDDGKRLIVSRIWDIHADHVNDIAGSDIDRPIHVDADVTLEYVEGEGKYTCKISAYNKEIGRWSFEKIESGEVDLDPDWMSNEIESIISDTCSDDEIVQDLVQFINPEGDDDETNESFGPRHSGSTGTLAAMLDRRLENYLEDIESEFKSSGCKSVSRTGTFGNEVRFKFKYVGLDFNVKLSGNGKSFFAEETPSSSLNVDGLLKKLKAYADKLKT